MENNNSKNTYIHGLQFYSSAVMSRRPLGVIKSVAELKKLCDQGARIYEAMAKGDTEQKKYLPAVVVQSYVPDGLDRSEGTSIPRQNDAVFTDFDSHDPEAAEALVDDILALKADGKIDLYYLSLSASGSGVHVVNRCFPGCETIEESQHHLCELLGNKYDNALDKAVHDFSRIMFVNPWEYVRYINQKKFFDLEEDEDKDKSDNNKNDDDKS